LLGRGVIYCYRGDPQWCNLVIIVIRHLERGGSVMHLKNSSKFGIAGKLLAGLIGLSGTLWGAGFLGKKAFT